MVRIVTTTSGPGTRCPRPRQVLLLGRIPCPGPRVLLRREMGAGTLIPGTLKLPLKVGSM